MGDRVIAALVPPRLALSPTARLAQVGRGRLPLVELLALPRAGALRYGMARVDSEGRVSNGATITALGWVRGDRLHISLIAESVVVHRDPSGAFTMGGKPYLVLPAAVRRRSGVRTGDQVLVAADPNHDVLVVHPLSVLDSMITDYHSSLMEGGESHDRPDQ